RAQHHSRGPTRWAGGVASPQGPQDYRRSHAPRCVLADFLPRNTKIAVPAPPATTMSKRSVARLSTTGVRIGLVTSWDPGEGEMWSPTSDTSTHVTITHTTAIEIHTAVARIFPRWLPFLGIELPLCQL